MLTVSYIKTRHLRRIEKNKVCASHDPNSTAATRQACRHVCLKEVHFIEQTVFLFLRRSRELDYIASTSRMSDECQRILERSGRD
jgi:hypothetical protein